MIARGIPRQLVERLTKKSLRRQHAVSHVAERVRIRLPKVVQVLSEVRWRLADGLKRNNLQVVPAALLSEEAKVLFAIGRYLAEHCDAGVPVSSEPGGTERGITTTVAIPESKAIVAGQTLSTGPTDEGDFEFVCQRSGDDRVVGAVGAQRCQYNLRRRGT